MNQIEIVAIDLDGTLLDDNKQLSDKNIDTLNQIIKKGIKVMICTGRTLPSVKPIIDNLALNGEEEYLVLQNGAVIHQLPNYEIIDSSSISPDNRTEVIKVVSAIVDSPITFYDSETIYYLGSLPFSQRTIEDGRVLASDIKVSSKEEILSLDNVFKIAVIDEPNILDYLENQLPKKLNESVDIIRSQPFILEFVPKDINKATALQFLSKKLKFERSHIMAIGDQANDLEMIEFAGIGVAMNNAIPALKEKADMIKGNNNESGVAEILEDLLL